MNPLNFFLISMISILWSAAGLIFLLWAVSKYAERFNRSQTGWVILAIFFSPFLAFLGLYMVGKRKVNEVVTNRPSTSPSRTESNHIDQERSECISEVESNDDKKPLNPIWFFILFFMFLILILPLLL